MNPLITSPPKIKMASKTKKVLSEVLKVRLRVAVQSSIKNLLSFTPFLQSHILPDPVKHNHRIVDGVTHHGKYRRNKRLVELQGKRQDSIENGEKPNTINTSCTRATRAPIPNCQLRKRPVCKGK